MKAAIGNKNFVYGNEYHHHDAEQAGLEKTPLLKVNNGRKNYGGLQCWESEDYKPIQNEKDILEPLIATFTLKRLIKKSLNNLVLAILCLM